MFAVDKKSAQQIAEKNQANKKNEKSMHFTLLRFEERERKQIELLFYLLCVYAIKNELMLLCT